MPTNPHRRPAPFRLLPWLCALPLSALPVSAWAQSIRTDGSLGPAQTLAGPDYLIPQSLGKLAGANLFHSFQTFNIAPGETATFTTSSPAIANVISRVTGGSPSLLNGKLSLAAAGGSPAFYFINPAGVVFGAGAAIDVPGAFHVGTADYVKFPDGNFYADLGRASTFSVAAPEAFGFLGGPPAALSVKDGASLVGAPGQDISLVAGDMGLDNGRVGVADGNILAVALGPGSQEVGLAGAPLPAAAGRISLSNGGSINALSTTATAARIRVDAGNIEIDGGGKIRFTGIRSATQAGSAGNAADIEMAASGAIDLMNGGEIASATSGAGRAGNLLVQSAELGLQGSGPLYPSGIVSRAFSGSTGNAGEVRVTVAGQIAIAGGAYIVSDTFAAGNAGTVRVEAGSLVIDAGGSSKSAGISSQAGPGSTGNAGDLTVAVAGNLAISEGGLIMSATSGLGRAGSIDIQAASLAIDGRGSPLFTGISTSTEAGSRGDAGSIAVTVGGGLNIAAGGEISSTTAGLGNAGSLAIRAGDLAIDGRGHSGFTGISSEASTGSAGNVQVAAKNSLLVVDGGEIASGTFGPGEAGAIDIQAGNMTIDARGSDLFTGISSQANSGSSGNAGPVSIWTAGELVVRNGGAISLITLGSGDAGKLSLQAGSLTIDGGGSAGFTYIGADSHAGGRAGDMDIAVARDLNILAGGQISSAAYGQGSGGTLRIQAANIAIDGRGVADTGITSAAAAGSTGDAGDIALGTPGRIDVVDGGLIASGTFGAGRGGSIRIQAGGIAIDAAGSPAFTGITTQAGPGSAGEAGSIAIVLAGDLKLAPGGEISSSTYAAGSAGTVDIRAANVAIDGQASINALAGSGSSGQAGQVSVVATESIALANGGRISIENNATPAAPAAIQPTLLRVSAPDLVVTSGAAVTTRSSGDVAASDIRIDFGPSLRIASGTISTSANLGNGGSITIAGGGLALLQDAQVTTSVAGLAGNGGDIFLAAETLRLETGFIQANTAARPGVGGSIHIAVDHLLPSGNSLMLAGSEPYAFRAGVFGFNVIQAAAPDGVSGSVEVTAPRLDLAGKLSGLAVPRVEGGGLARTLCQSLGDSSLGAAGRGGLPPSARDFLRIDSAGDEMLAPRPAGENISPAFSGACR